MARLKTGRIPAKGGKPAITYKKGGLHQSTGTPAAKKISPAKHAAARSGSLGPLAKKREIMAENIFHTPKPAVARKRGKR